MGCDIHLHAEKFDPYSKTWVCNGDDIYGNRNYAVFSALANVRNDREPITPISKPRGLPKDVSSMVREEAEGHWGNDGHSHSYLTLKELKEYDWSQADLEFYEEAIPRLEDLRGKSRDEHVRIVFWFDC